jgi:hypothetical protein
MKKVYLTLFLSIFFIILQTEYAFGQFGIGASIERNMDTGNVSGVPKSGIGLRIENGFGPKLPLIKLGYRVHGSVFNADFNYNDISGELGSQNAESNVYDFGAALVGELKIPFFANPYAGLGIGYEVQNIKSLNELSLQNTANRVRSIEENSFYYNAFVGLKFTPIPILHPFIEFRYSGFTELDAITDSPTRLQFGIMLDF